MLIQSMLACMQLCILDGSVYDQRFLEGGAHGQDSSEPQNEIDACVLLLNKRKVSMCPYSDRIL